MIVNLKNLKSVLKTKISEYEMLNKSLLEMIEKGANKESIKDMRKAIDETQTYIKNLQMDIEDMELEEEKTEYSFYDSLKKPKLAKSVKMKTAKEELKRAVDEANDLLNMPKTNLYDSIKKENDEPKKNYEDELHYKKQYECKMSLNNPYDGAVYANRFLVRFHDSFEIPEWLVRKVSFAPNHMKELYVTISDFVYEKNGRKRPIIADITSRLLPFSISIDHLDATGVVVYTERYHGCRIIEVNKGDLGYGLDDLAYNEMRISYSDVTYEATN